MKSFLTIASVLLFASTSAMASGFLCRGDGYKAKLYNNIYPHQGTSNPNVLVVSRDVTNGPRTIVVLKDDEIRKEITAEKVIYGGTTNGYVDGRWVSATLEVEKVAAFPDTYFAELTLNANGQSRAIPMICDYYRKNPAR